MKPVDMVEFREKDPNVFGDCFRCCLASVLELEHNDVPHVMQISKTTGRSWVYVVNEWLQPKHLWYCELLPDRFPSNYMTSNGNYWIGSGFSPRFPKEKHSVVLQNSDLWTFNIVHDPHPSRAGLLDGRITEIGMFVNLCR
jgi:hypothetical protein